jgi:membrane protein DedA with SNARE-associated domain
MTEAILDIAERAIAEGGYLMLGLLILIENLFPPIPSEAILPLAGYGVFRGTLSFIPAVLAATAGSVAGAVVLYLVGRYGGRPVLLRYGRLLRLDERKLDRADDWFDRHGPKIVFFGRFLPGLRSIVSIPAGMSEMPWRTFVPLTAAGSALWNIALIEAGLALGEGWEAASRWVDTFDVVVLAALVVGTVVLVAYYLRRRRFAETRPVR